MADLAGSGALDLSVMEHHACSLEQINEAHGDLPSRHGGSSDYARVPPPDTTGRG